MIPPYLCEQERLFLVEKAWLSTKVFSDSCGRIHYHADENLVKKKIAERISSASTPNSDLGLVAVETLYPFKKQTIEKKSSKKFLRKSHL